MISGNGHLRTLLDELRLGRWLEREAAVPRGGPDPVAQADVPREDLLGQGVLHHALYGSAQGPRAVLQIVARLADDLKGRIVTVPQGAYGIIFTLLWGLCCPQKRGKVSIVRRSVLPHDFFYRFRFWRCI